MFPVEQGAEFPFNVLFQRYLFEQLTSLLMPSSWFSTEYGEEWKLIFNVSARWSLDEDDTERGVKLSESARVKLARYRSFTPEPLRVEIRGPTVFRKDKDVEYSIFLPFRRIIESVAPAATTLNYIFTGVYEILERMQFDASRLRAEQNRIVSHICSESKMIDVKLATKIGVDPSVWSNVHKI
jgi:hypothetical protein